MAKDDYTSLFIIGGLGVAAYVLYQNGTLATWFPSLFAAAQPTTPPKSTAGSGVTTQQTGTGPAPGSTAPSTPPSTVSAPAPSVTGAPGLSADNAATYPFSSAVTAAQMTQISQALMAKVNAGQIPLISGASVLAYMLGWGNQPAGSSIKQVRGFEYIFDGSNWKLGAPPKLSDALTQWAAAHGYSSSLTNDQWNYVLNTALVPGSPAEMLDPSNGQAMAAIQWVQNLANDPNYDSSSITPKYGLAGRSNFFGRGSRVPTRLVHTGPSMRMFRAW